MLLEIFLRGFIGAGLASLGFAVLFNVRNYYVWYAAFAGGVGGFVYLICSKMLNMDAAVSNFLGAIALTICAEIIARKLKITVTTILACALIPLVPGGDAYRFMTAFIDGDIYKGLSYALSTFTIAGMICLGTLIVSALTRFFFFTRGKMEKAVSSAKTKTESVKSSIYAKAPKRDKSKSCLDSNSFSNQGKITKQNLTKKQSKNSSDSD
ncbi:threonine/serine exporter family protein [Ileibacterium valens]|uniref:threonine/serine exporter family protein n=1 Tax=Ileibacterium valens TaxID=1862668 RepID=UPI00259AF380|nr:threonine/serine exporter family protein [Ileibacterium valens]